MQEPARSLKRLLFSNWQLWMAACSECNGDTWLGLACSVCSAYQPRPCLAGLATFVQLQSIVFCTICEVLFLQVQNMLWTRMRRTKWPVLPLLNTTRLKPSIRRTARQCQHPIYIQEDRRQTSSPTRQQRELTWVGSWQLHFQACSFFSNCVIQRYITCDQDLDFFNLANSLYQHGCKASHGLACMTPHWTFLDWVGRHKFLAWLQHSPVHIFLDVDILGVLPWREFARAAPWLL